jgi:transcriptional regulator with XRE-family HTH domain
MPTIAEKIKELRSSLGWSTTQLAKHIGVNQSTVSKYELGVQEPKTEPNQKLAELAGMTLGQWLGVEPLAEDARARTVVIVGELQAGYWREAVEWDHDAQYPVSVYLDPDTPNYPLQGYIVRGTSMNRIYPDGTVVFVASTISNGLHPEDGQYVLVTRRNKDGLYEASLKEYVVERDGTINLMPRSYDPEHQKPLVVDDGNAEEVTITGVVMGAYLTAPRRRS